MNSVHFVLQGKGGVGKTLISSILYQYLSDKNINISGIDTDPVNSTFSGYKKLNIRKINILDGDRVDHCKFDALVEIILNKSGDDHVVVDNGASSFISLCSYIKENAVVELLSSNGIGVNFHSVITGGQAIGDTASGLGFLAMTFPDVDIVVWLNKFFGEITTSDKKTFSEFNVYKDNVDRIKSIVAIPLFHRDTFGKDLEELFSRRETFAAAIASSLPVMTRQRLKMFWTAMQAELDKAQLI